jgi:hypothetical protein
MTTKKKEPPKKPRFINLGILPLSDPIYSTGPIVNGRKILEKEPPPKKPGGYINHGLAKPDDPIFSTGPIVNGRKILEPRKSGPSENN